MSLKTVQIVTNGALKAQRKLYELGLADHIGAWIDVAAVVLEEAKQRNTKQSIQLAETLTDLNTVNDEAFKYAKDLHPKVKAAVLLNVFGA